MGTFRILFRLPLFFMVTAFLGLLSILCFVCFFAWKSEFRSLCRAMLMAKHEKICPFVEYVNEPASEIDQQYSFEGI